MRILLATDGSEFSFAAARKCCELVSSKKDIAIRIISVIETISPIEPFGTSDEYYIMVQKAARSAAEKNVEDTRQTMLKTLGETKVDIEAEAISGRPNQTIIDEAEKWRADLIVVGSQGHGFWGRMLLGSVSNAVVTHAPCSVLVVRGSESQDKN
jgi:nucleotide-binding universal stress UspA family protein